MNPPWEAIPSFLKAWLTQLPDLGRKIQQCYGRTGKNRQLENKLWYSSKQTVQPRYLEPPAPPPVQLASLPLDFRLFKN